MTLSIPWRIVPWLLGAALAGGGSYLGTSSTDGAVRELERAVIAEQADRREELAGIKARLDAIDRRLEEIAR